VTTRASRPVLRRIDSAIAGVLATTWWAIAMSARWCAPSGRAKWSSHMSTTTRTPRAFIDCASISLSA
jgi:hypothetical protein